MTAKTIYSWFGYSLPVKERLRLIAEAGFDGVLIWWGGGLHTPDYRRQPEYARELGLFVENIHAPFEQATSLWLDTLEGDETEQMLMDCLQVCHDNRIPTLVVHPTSGGAPPPGLTGLNRFRRLADKAERLEVQIALENIKFLEYPRYLFKNISSPRLGFCYDSGHHHAKTPNEDPLAEFGSRLMALHLHDNQGYIRGENPEDQHRLPFDGSIDWQRVMQTIAQTGYNGSTALEPGPRYLDLSPEEFLAEALHRAEQLSRLRQLT